MKQRGSHKERTMKNSGLKKTKMGILGCLAKTYIQILTDFKVQLEL